MLNPVKIFELLDVLGRHVKTDIGMGELNNLIGLEKEFNLKNVRQKVFDTSPEGLLYAATSDKGAYILLPVGENFEKIQEACKNIFN